MKAMIFAAGLGTRLKPITDSIPKALVKVGNKTLLEIAIDNLKKFGFGDIIINVHHFADKVISYLAENDNFGANISISDESGLLLDTGGGLFKASSYFDDEKPFLVHNVDIISTVDLREMYSYHFSSGNLVTLAVKTRQTERKLLFDNDLYLCGRINHKTDIQTITRATDKQVEFAFSGIHVINPELFNFSKRSGPFALMNLYLELSAYYKIGAYIHEQAAWLDVGKPETLKLAENLLNTINNQSNSGGRILT